MVVDQQEEEQEGEQEKEHWAPMARVREQLLQSSWCGLLAATALLLDAATEDTTTENILKSMTLYSSLAARLELPTLRCFTSTISRFLVFLRDSFITAVCKASLPPHYTLSVLKV